MHCCIRPAALHKYFKNALQSYEKYLSQHFFAPTVFHFYRKNRYFTDFLVFKVINYQA